jgi:hypothetical protein
LVFVVYFVFKAMNRNARRITKKKGALTPQPEPRGPNGLSKGIH